MRKRFKTARICSSENYTISIRIHRQDLLNNHVKLIQSVSIHKVAYTLVFGKKMYLTEEQVIRLQKSTIIHYE